MDRRRTAFDEKTGDRRQASGISGVLCLRPPASCRLIVAFARHRRIPSGSGRGGFSLFEVVISLAIFVVSLAAIGQLISTGMRGSVQSRLQTEAVFRCESKLAEVIAGVTALSAASDQPFDDDAAWTWSVSLAAGPQSDLYLVEVTVDLKGEGTLSSTSYSLRRLVRDPEAVAAMQQEKQAAQSASGTSGSSGGGR